jgi:adenylate cyclase
MEYKHFMGVEIERKYLVNKDKWKDFEKVEGTFYRQGYILTDPNKTIRIRLTDKQGYLTIKGLAVGMSRPEFEYAIPTKDAKELLDNFCITTISKIRYKVKFAGKLWEVDEFLDDNEGLLTAEIELRGEQEQFDLPSFIDKEVTGEKKYYSSNLSINPYRKWKE